MAEKRYYWLKLKADFYDDDGPADFLMSQKDGANYVVLYQMLCLKTINTNGRLENQIGDYLIRYDLDKIQRIGKYFTADTVRNALNLFKALGLVYEENDGTIVIANYGDLVGSETKWKEIKAAQRAKNLPKLKECKRLNQEMIRLPSGKTQYVDEKRYGGNGMLAFDMAGGKCEVCGGTENLCIHHGNGYSNDIKDLYVLCETCHSREHNGGIPGGLVHNWIREIEENPSESKVQNGGHDSGQVGGHDGGQGGGQVHLRDRDRDLEIDTREIDTRDIEKEITVPKGTVCRTKDVRLVINEWNKTDFKHIERISPDTKRGEMVRKRIVDYGVAKVVEAVQRANQSQFLKGFNSKGWTADFDWFIKPSNFQKVLEGNYDNRGVEDGQRSEDGRGKVRGYHGDAGKGTEDFDIHIDVGGDS